MEITPALPVEAKSGVTGCIRVRQKAPERMTDRQSHTHTHTHTVRPLYDD